MKFRVIDKALHIQTETPAEVAELIQHYGLDMLSNTEALSTGLMQHVKEQSKRDNAQWFAVSCGLGPNWFAPYAERLEKWTGYTGDVPMISAPRYPGNYVKNLCHTHICSDAAMGTNGFVFHGFQHSADWNGRKASERAAPYFKELCAAGVGDTQQEPEFIEHGNGLMKRNPNYMKRHNPHPSPKSALIFDTLLSWWLAERATPGQRDIIDRCLANHRTVCKSDTLGAYLLRSYESGYRVSWGGALVSLDEFKGA